MREQGVETLGRRVGMVAPVLATGDLRRDARGPFGQRLGRGIRCRQVGWPRRVRRTQRGPQHVEPVAAARHGRHDRDTEPLGQPVGVEHEPAARGQVDHVERDGETRRARQQLADEHEVARQVARVDDDDHRIGRVTARAGQHRAGDVRLGRVDVEVVDPRQVEHLQRATRLAVPGPHRGRRAREIRGLGPRAAQRIEERGLAGVRVADQRDAPDRGRGDGRSGCGGQDSRRHGATARRRSGPRAGAAPRRVTVRSAWSVPGRCTGRPTCRGGISQASIRPSARRNGRDSASRTSWRVDTAPTSTVVNGTAGAVRGPGWRGGGIGVLQPLYPRS